MIWWHSFFSHPFCCALEHSSDFSLVINFWQFTRCNIISVCRKIGLIEMKYKADESIPTGKSSWRHLMVHDANILRKFWISRKTNAIANIWRKHVCFSSTRESFGNAFNETKYILRKDILPSQNTHFFSRSFHVWGHIKLQSKRVPRDTKKNVEEWESNMNYKQNAMGYVWNATLLMEDRVFSSKNTRFMHIK